MILIALGANLPSAVGPPAVTLRAALMELTRFDIMPVASSRFFVAPAWPNPNDPSYVNAVARIESNRAPKDLMAALHEIEARFGRTRGERNAPRPLDLDLLDYEGRIEKGPPELPHPRIERRGFVLLPLADVAPGWRHPASGRSLQELVDNLPAGERDLPVLKSED